MKNKMFFAALMMCVVVTGCVRTKGTTYTKTANGYVAEEWGGYMSGPATLQPRVVVGRWYDGYPSYRNYVVVQQAPTWGGYSSFSDSSQRHIYYSGFSDYP